MARPTSRTSVERFFFFLPPSHQICDLTRNAYGIKIAITLRCKSRNEVNMGTKSGRLCECGCGKTISRYRKSDTRFFNDACRKRQNRRERGETPPAVTMCACECGEVAIGPRKLYAKDACRQRAYRKRKEFDELGGEFEWSERPETPRKIDRRGYKIT